MSRLMADQESCGGAGDPGVAEEDSVNKTNQINQIDEIDETDETDQKNQKNRARSARELCSFDAFLYKNDCAGR